jgi:hypothetical protein
MFSGVRGIDGSAWYHPRRLSLDGQAVAGGVRNRAQRVLGVRAWHGDALDLPIYAFETSLGAGRVLRGARALARRSRIARRRVTLVDRSRTYDHVDPLSAVPSKNAFLKTVIPFLRRAGDQPAGIASASAKSTRPAVVSASRPVSAAMRPIR